MFNREEEIIIYVTINKWTMYITPLEARHYTEIY